MMRPSSTKERLSSVKPHPFVEDVELTTRVLGRTRQWCLCGLPAENRHHVAPRTAARPNLDDSAELDRRKVGDRD